MILLIYDISDNTIRNRISELCKDRGLARLQKSAFFGEIEQEKVKNITEEINGTLDRGVTVGSDSVIVFSICDTCIKKQLSIGKGLLVDKYRDSTYFIVE